MEMKKPDQPALDLPSSLSTVSYCCGACGYDLKLSSSARDTAGMVVAGGGGGYRRGRGGVVRFGAIDDARFGHVDEFRCVDVRARRLFTRRTRLLCRKCGAHVGFAYDDRAARSPSSSPPPRYDIKIRALHPIEANSTHLSRPISE
uniref:Yippee domain-containing protein n=1 Tax=Oryza punctata TaxID=4537 RepID=A0A0E0KY27_ORYPU